MSNVTTLYYCRTLPPSEFVNRAITTIQLLYGVPSLALMVHFLIFLRKYPNSFYRLVQLNLLTNIFCYLNSWITLRLRYYSIRPCCLFIVVTWIPDLLTLSYELSYFFLHMQFFSTISLSIHRITSILYHVHYDKLWSKYYIHISFLFIVYGLIPSWAIPGTKFTFHVENNTIFQVFYTERIQNAMLISSMLTVVYFFLLLTVGLSTACLVTRTMQVNNIADRGIGKTLTRIALTYVAVSSGILYWSVMDAINRIFEFLPQFLEVYGIDVLVFSSDAVGSV
uniref:Serpentine receptor class gamma n=1 Tax=Caenorhabditis japonica TaxID=281687 RepID=A0A8R1E453_CAEJA